MADRDFVDSLSERELLARLLQAEAGSEGTLGRLAVGSVIRNRAQSGNFGEGIRGVLLQPGQFSPLNSVTGYAGGEQGRDFSSIEPTDVDYQVADAVLSGQIEDPTGGATHFYNPDISQPEWGEAAGGEWQRIGQHIFGRTGSGRSDYEAPEAQATEAARRAQYGTGDRGAGSMMDVVRAREDGLINAEEAQQLISERLMAGEDMDDQASLGVSELRDLAALTQQPQQSTPSFQSLSRYGPRLSGSRPSATSGTQALKRMGVGSLLSGNPLLGMG